MIKVKRIGIITINDNNNYGNRLQNYTTFFTLNKIGYEVKTIENYHLFNNILKYGYRRIRFRHFNKDYSSHKEKANNFKIFNSNILFDSKEMFPLRTLSEYDFVLVGSDQVWHPLYSLDCVKALKYVKPEKRISFAASFGVDSIDEKSKKIVRQDISRFKAISVREDAGAKIIKEITGRDATVLIDPTMLLDKEEWLKVSKMPKNMIDKPYILTYFLSPTSKSTEDLLRKYSKGRNVIRLLHDNDVVAQDAGPSEFLYLFNHADLVLTDSFHACVFSFLFGKPFMVFDRNISGQSMNSRIDTLLKKFKLERKYAKSRLKNDIWEHDYEEGYVILKEERKKTFNFLKQAIGD